MEDVRLSVPSLLMIVAVVGAGAFAVGRTMPADSAAPVAAPMPRPREAPATEPVEDPMPPGHPATARGGSSAELPPGHPSVDPAGATGTDPGSFPQATVSWKAPARWQLVPNASSMRIATYRIPHAAGDTVDPELSIIRAGGTVEANADRWVGQFDEAGQKSAKRSTRTVGGLEVTIVEVKGTYSGGMAKEATPTSDWVLLGAIVPTAEMPHFFKLTGPAKSVAAARAEFDAFIGSLAPR